MEKKIIVILLAVSLAVVLLPIVSSKLSMHNIPIYVFDDACAGKTLIASINFSDYTNDNLSEVPNEDWIIGKSSNGGVADIEDHALRLSNANLRLNISTHPMPINATVYVVAKVNTSKGYTNYKSYSQANLGFQQNLYAEEKRYKNPGIFIFSRNGGKGSGVTIRDQENLYETKKVNTFAIKTINSHYQTKWNNTNRGVFNNYLISRSFNGSDFVKKFSINGQLTGKLNLTKAYTSGADNKINYKDNFVAASYPYQAIYIRKVEICA